MIRKKKSSRGSYLIDTTLRDGEQAAGGTLNLQEKLEIARQLEKLRVDVIEAGFPISSPGDFEAVNKKEHREWQWKLRAVAIYTVDVDI